MKTPKQLLERAYRNGSKTNEEIYELVSKECDMSMQITLNEMYEDMEENNEDFVLMGEIHS